MANAANCKANRQLDLFASDSQFSFLKFGPNGGKLSSCRGGLTYD